MPKYRVLEHSFIQNGYREENSIIDLDDSYIPGPNVELIEDDAEPAAAAKKVAVKAKRASDAD